MRTRTFTLLAATAVAVAAPTATATAATTNVPVFHQKDSGRSVTELVGKVFKVRLEVCGDCGSSLRLITPDTRVLRVVNRSLKSTAKPPAVGGEQFETWTFKARNPGTAKIAVTQKDAEKGGKVHQRFELTVHVTKLVTDG